MLIYQMVKDRSRQGNNPCEFGANACSPILIAIRFLIFLDIKYCINDLIIILNFKFSFF
jgi:hypothetical protein